jgi:hypothetical protein
MSQDGTRPVLRPRLAASCQIMMGVAATAHMLILMLLTVASP